MIKDLSKPLIKNSQGISIAHLYVYGKLREKIGNGYFFDKKILDEIVGRHIVIPKSYKKDFINEMVKNGMLNKESIRIYSINKIKSPKKIYDFYGDLLFG